jgi:hypothetical protein
MNVSYRLGLSVNEVAWLLTLSESQVRYQLRVGRLSYVVPPRLVSVESVRAFFPFDDLLEVREHVLARLVRGDLEAPRSASRYARHTIRTLIETAAQAHWPEPDRTARSLIVSEAFAKRENRAQTNE